MNRSWILARRPKGMVQISDFERREFAIPSLEEGESLVKVLYLSFDPAQRGWMNDNAESYVPAIHVGEIMRARGIGEIVESKNPNWNKGDLIVGGLGWQEYAILSKDNIPKHNTSYPLPVSKMIPGITPEMALNACGGVGMTAYFGLLRVGELIEGQTVLVSGAAGATGSIVGQIAKIKGCTVIGIAGGSEKCKWLKEELHFDHVIDYKTDDVGNKLRDLAPNGVNIYFDNVGGEILEAAIDNLAMKARIVICGSISGYNSEVGWPSGPRNYMKLLVKRARMEGLVVFDYLKEFPSAIQEIVGWIQEGKLKTKEDIQYGFENIPSTFLRLFNGLNTGKQLLKFYP